MIHGLVAPGYEMADIVANHLTGTSRYFCRTTTATKLKLMGVDVASFGHFVPPAEGGKSDRLRRSFPRRLSRSCWSKPRRHENLGRNSRRRYSNYDRLVGLFHGDNPLAVQPESLLFGEREARPTRLRNARRDANLLVQQRDQGGDLPRHSREEALRHFFTSRRHAMRPPVAAAACP